jgi:integrase
MVNLAQATNLNEVGKVNNSLQSALDTYFSELSHQSENTSRNYKNWFEDFFKFAYEGKQMKFITWEDISNQEYINVNTIKKYRIYLSDKKDNGNVTINMKVSALKALFQELNNIQVMPLNMSAFNVKRLKEGKTNTYGTLTDEEIKNLFTYCREKENNGDIKSLMFECMYLTAFRFEAVRTLQVKNVKQKADKDSGLNIWTIKVTDKGNKDLIKAISDKFYDKLSILLNG